MAAIVAIVVGAGLGAGAGWFVLVRDDEEPTAATAEGDARHVCDIAGRYPDGIDLMATGGLDEDPVHYLVGLMPTLARGAATEDPAYEVLVEPTERVSQARNTFDTDGIGTALDDVRAACADLGLEGAA
ncbi:hypothetical protein ACPYO6_06990 [Georgenia sp. Z1344]|uniref:hypothetical protein n=1 Tax=Georgenia sp. Z1344 TaxID=3416706 RepID=UPI003CF1A0B2